MLITILFICLFRKKWPVLKSAFFATTTACHAFDSSGMRVFLSDTAKISDKILVDLARSLLIMKVYHFNQ